jgi:hypothetical protein
MKPSRGPGSYETTSKWHDFLIIKLTGFNVKD